MDDLIEPYACALRIGVTGHRAARLGDADVTAIHRSVRAVLDHIASLVPGAPWLTLVSSLADGADSIAADAALALGWRLDTVLPLPRSDYADDFAAGHTQAAHKNRLAQAHAVFELNADPDRAAAYQRAGRVVLAQSDLLLAVWDGDPARGRGGSAQIVAEAVRAGIPVIHVDPASPDTPALLWHGFGAHGLSHRDVDTVPRGGLDRLPELVRVLVEPPCDPLDKAMIAILEGRSQPRRWRFAAAYPLMLAFLGVRRIRRGDFVAARPSRVEDPIATWYARADHGAALAAQHFRSAYVMNFTLMAVAVAASLARLAAPQSTFALLAVLEIAAIATILLVTHIGRRAHWHRRWLDQRHLAEQLRCLLVMRRLGQVDLPRAQRNAAGCVEWVERAAGRVAGLPAGCVTAAYLDDVRTALLDLIEDQLGYLRTDARRMHALEHRLHITGTTLFVTTALVCVVMFVLEVVTHAHVPPLISIVATIVSAAFPALGAAIYGIRTQGDFAGIAERNAAAADRLDTLRDLALDTSADFDLLWQLARETREVLTQDVLAWLRAYRARPLVLPG